MNQKDKFKKDYPAVTGLMLLSFIPIVIIAVVIVLAIVLGAEGPPGAFVIGALSAIGTTILCLFMFFAQLRSRLWFHKSFVGAGGGIFYFVEPGISLRENLIRDVVLKLACMDTMLEVSHRLKKIHTDVQVPKASVFCIFLRPERVFFRVVTEYFRGKIFGKELQMGNQIRVRWDGNRKETSSLVAHGIAHFVLQETDPNLSESRHHEIIGASEIDLVGRTWV